MDDTLAPVWKALADPTRRQLLDLLRDQPRTTGALAAAFPALSRFAVMKHLGVLEAAGLVIARKRGREVWHYLNAVPLQRIYERWVSAYQGQWASSLLNIQQVAEHGRTAAKEVTQMEMVQIEQEVQIAATPDRVFAALVDPDAWWSVRYAGAVVSFEPQLGGRFIQRFNDTDNGVLWAIVTCYDPGKKLSLDGTLNMPGAVAGVVNYELEPHTNGTRLKLQHYAVGVIAAETQAEYDAGWQELLRDRLTAYVERGVRYVPAE